MKIPQGYKYTELGIIPEDWEIKRISEFTDIITGGTPNTSLPEYWGGDIKWMNSGELNLKFVKDVEGRITNEGLNNSSTHLIPTNCVLIGLAGQGKTRGTAAFTLIPLCTNQSIAAILPSNEHNSLYLYYVVDSLYEYLRLLSSGDGGRGGLNKNLLNSLQIKMPKSIEEQRRIAEVLSDVDGLIAALDKKIAKKKLIKQATMQQLLTGKKRLQGFSGEWSNKCIYDICEILDNKRIPLNDKQRVAGQYPYCGANGIVDYINQYIFEEELILIAEDGGNFEQFETRPIAYIMNGKYWVNNHAHILKAKLDFSQSFIFHQLVHKNITDYIVGGTRSKLTRARLEQISLYIPNDKTEQQAIATILSDMDAEISDLERKRDKYKLLKNGMLQKLLTGQIRLK